MSRSITKLMVAAIVAVPLYANVSSAAPISATALTNAAPSNIEQIRWGGGWGGGRGWGWRGGGWGGRGWGWGAGGFAAGAIIGGAIASCALLLWRRTLLSEVITHLRATTPSRVMAVTTAFRTACSATGHTIRTAARSWAMMDAVIPVRK